MKAALVSEIGSALPLFDRPKGNVNGPVAHTYKCQAQDQNVGLLDSNADSEENPEVNSMCPMFSWATPQTSTLGFRHILK